MSTACLRTGVALSILFGGMLSPACRAPDAEPATTFGPWPADPPRDAGRGPGVRASEVAWSTFISLLTVVGDHDGDGIDEYLVGDRTNGGALDHAGDWIELRDGRTSRALWSSPREPRWERGDARAVGDLDGHGAADFAVWRRLVPYDKTERRPGEGEPYLLSCHSTETLLPLWTIATHCPTAVLVRDFDGDGVPDVLLALSDEGSGGLADGGVVQIRSGRDGSLLNEVSGSGNVDHFDTAVAELDDLDGDGVGDVAIGSYGRLELCSGRTLSRLPGRRVDMMFPCGAWAVPDVDGDGQRELLVGEGWSEQGATLTLWKPSPLSATWKVGIPGYADTRSRLVLLEANVVGDIDGDARADIVVAVSNESEPPLPCVLACFSAADGAVLWSRPFAERGFVRAVAWEDLDADGVRELLVGHFNVDHGGPAGRLFVIDGARGTTVREIE